MQQFGNLVYWICVCLCSIVQNYLLRQYSVLKKFISLFPTRVLMSMSGDDMQVNGAEGAEGVEIAP